MRLARRTNEIRPNVSRLNARCDRAAWKSRSYRTLSAGHQHGPMYDLGNGLFWYRTTVPRYADSKGTPPHEVGARVEAVSGGSRLMKYVLFSYDGRINRKQYWTMGILPLLGLAFLWGSTFSPIPYWFPWVSILVWIVTTVSLVWGFTAVSVKRCHDIGHSGFWTLFYLIPGVPLVGLIVLGAWPSSGPNKYDQVEQTPAWLRRGKMALAPLAVLCALFIYYWPLWEPSLNAPPRVDYEGPEGFYPTPEEMEAGAEILRASGIVEQINGGQEWEPVHRVFGDTWQRGTRRLIVEAKWSEPVEHSGPWSWTDCDEPRKVVTRQKWSNITILGAWIDLDQGRVLRYDPSAWDGDYEQPVIGGTNPFGLARVYDVRTGRHLITGPKILILPQPFLCTPGGYYRD